MILDKEIEITVVPRFVEYYKNLGYECKSRQKILINIKDLPKASKLKVKCECDICGNIKEITYFSYLRNIEKYNYYCCSQKCSKSKSISTNLEKYGVEYFNNIEKRINTTLEKYGVEHTLQREDVKEKSKETCLKNHGVEYSMQSGKIREKAKQTSLEKYDTEYPMQNKDIQQKAIDTNLENLGVQYPSQNNMVLEKIKISKLKNHGNENYNNRDKYKETCLELFGVDNPMKNSKIVEKLHNTMLERYGVKHASQYEEFFNKMLKSGLKIEKYNNSDLYFQGTYEKDFLDKYFNTFNITRGKEITYIYNKEEHKYFPDFYIEELNLIIEIKSDYWFENQKEKNLLKKEYSKKEGYNFLFIINKNYDEFEDFIKFNTYKKEHCWQYQIRLDNLNQDIDFIKNKNIEIDDIKIKDFDFEYIDKNNKDDCKNIKNFIEKYEWLGNMPNRPTHRFIAKYKGILAGVVVMATPNSQSKYLGEDTKNLEKLISRGACASWTPKNLASSLIMWSIRWMVNNTDFRLFTAYSDPEAKELGTIYQACNFIYLGEQKVNKMYFDHNKPHLGWTTGRNFRKKSYYKNFAKILGIEWKEEWEKNYSVLWNNMSNDIEDMLKNYSKKYQNACSVRTPKAKHKYCYILGKDKKETKFLKKIFYSLNKDKENLLYPKER